MGNKSLFCITTQSLPLKHIRECLTLLSLLFTFKVFSQCTSVISTFPYAESFEVSTAGWSSGGTNNDWAWGSPAKPVINSAGAGSKCWIVGGLTSSFYNYGERSWVESPCFDFTTLNRPFVSFLIFWETENRYDGGNFQYSIDGGNSWSNVGTINTLSTCTDSNWFNMSSIINLNGLVNSQQGWSGTILPSSGSCNGGAGSGQWKLATHCIKNLANQPQVKFRFTFGSGTTCNDYDGIAFDDFKISEAPVFPVDFSFVCSNGLTLNFNDQYPDCHTFWEWDFGDPNSSGNIASGKNVSHTFSTGGDYSITLQTGGGCSVDTQIVKQVKLISASTFSQPVSCPDKSDGIASVIVNNPGPGLIYNWSNDPSLNAAINSGLNTGDYSVTVTEPGACNRSFLISVSLGPDAFPEVDLGNDTLICPGSNIFIYPGSYQSYSWQDLSNDSFFVIRKAGIYSVTITNSSGCTASDSINILEDCINDLIIPNTFTPNNDGINELFNVSGSPTTEYKLLVFNRWGELIFKSEERLAGWDGSYKGNPVQEGMYNYMVTFTVQGVLRNKTGAVLLLR